MPPHLYGQEVPPDTDSSPCSLHAAALPLDSFFSTSARADRRECGRSVSSSLPRCCLSPSFWPSQCRSSPPCAPFTSFNPAYQKNLPMYFRILFFFFFLRESFSSPLPLLKTSPLRLNVVSLSFSSTDLLRDSFSPCSLGSTSAVFGENFS